MLWQLDRFFPCSCFFLFCSLIPSPINHSHFDTNLIDVGFETLSPRNAYGKRLGIKHSLQIHCISKHRCRVCYVCSDAITNKWGVSRDVDSFYKPFFPVPFSLLLCMYARCKRKWWNNHHKRAYLLGWIGNRNRSTSLCSEIQYCIDNVHYVDILHNVRYNGAVLHTLTHSMLYNWKRFCLRLSKCQRLAWVLQCEHCTTNRTSHKPWVRVPVNFC